MLKPVIVEQILYLKELNEIIGSLGRLKDHNVLNEQQLNDIRRELLVYVSETEAAIQSHANMISKYGIPR